MKSLPQNGRIVVIDDNIEEALPLINILSKNKIAVSYFDGELDNLPESPFEDIRLIFLDIELKTGGQHEKTKISKVLAVLKRIIGSNKYPYILFAWTKHSELVASVVAGLASNPPIQVISVNKLECKDEEGNYNIAKIVDKLRENLREVDSIDVCIIWENIVNNAAGKTVGEIAAYYDYDADWNKNMKKLFWKMAVAYSGKNIEKDFIGSTLKIFNDVFIDKLEKDLDEMGHIDPITVESGQTVDIAHISKVNTLINLCIPYGGKSAPGNIYIDANKCVDKIELYDEKYMENPKNVTTVKQIYDTEYKNICVEVSPKCDYAQNKRKRSRLIPGIIVPFNLAISFKTADYQYKSPVFNINGDCCIIIFDLRLLYTEKIEDVDSWTPMFAFRHQLLVDIQSHVAKHIFRPGILALDNRKIEITEEAQ